MCIKILIVCLKIYCYSLQIIHKVFNFNCLFRPMRHFDQIITKFLLEEFAYP